MKHAITPLLALVALGLPVLASAAEVAGLPVLTVEAKGGAQTYSLTFQILILMTLLSLLPAILLAPPRSRASSSSCRSCARRSAWRPRRPNQVLSGLALFLTFS